MSKRNKIGLLAALFAAFTFAVVACGPGGGSGDDAGGNGDAGTTGDATTGGDTGGDGGTTGGDDGGGMNDDGGGMSGGGGWCAPSCEMASDCGDNADDWACESGWCEPDMCEMDADCVPTFSGFTNEGCSVGDCSMNYACVDHGDTTYCASKPLQGSCAVGMKTMKAKADGSGDVEVCVDSTATCNEGICQSGDSSGGCENDMQCGDLVCNESGECVCESDDQCSGDLTCSDGTCSCDSDAQCESAYPEQNNYACRKN